MKVIDEKLMQCPHCGEEHNVKVVEVEGYSRIKGVDICYKGIYEYCDVLEEMSAEGDMLMRNNISRKDAYKYNSGLLTSSEIRDIRAKYSISQKDLALILGWGSSTITRYETVQIQDEAHNDVLCLVRDDPKWLFTKLQSKEALFYSKNKAKQLRKYKDSISSFIGYYSVECSTVHDNVVCHESSSEYDAFNIQRFSELIQYILSIHPVHDVRLMRYLWMIDHESYKRYSRVISKLEYNMINGYPIPIKLEERLNASCIKSERVYDFNLDVSYIQLVVDKPIEYKYLTIKEREHIQEVIGDSDDYTYPDKVLKRIGDGDRIDFSILVD